ncbi:MAG: PAS domain S-box protein [Acidobacteriota bacterium]
MSPLKQTDAPTPIRFLAMLLGVTFVAELGVALLVHVAFRGAWGTLAEAAVAALLLVLVLAPAIWVLAIRPAMRHAIDPIVRKAIETSEDVVFLTDPEGTFQFVNAAFSRLYGYDADEVVGRATPRVLKGGITTPDEYASFWATILGRQSVATEFVNRAKDGRAVRVHVKVTPVLDAAGDLTGFLAIQRDLTEYRRMESALGAAEERYRDLFENAVAGIYRSTPDGHLLMVNPALARMFGYASPAEMIESVQDVGRQLYADPRQREDLRRQYDAGTGGEAEFQLVRRDGGLFWVAETTRVIRDGDGRVVCYEGIMTDITARKRAEADLRAERDRSKLYLDVVDVILVALNDRGEITLLNRTGRRVLGFDDDDPLGTNWFDTCVPTGHREEMRGRFAKWLGGHDVSFCRHENPVLTRTGDQRLISWHSVQLTDATGAVIGALNAGEDITERRRLEEQFRGAQKMESVGVLAGGVAHDFNNMLTAILGYTQLIMAALPADSPIRADLREVQLAGEEAADLTARLLAFGRRQMLRIDVADPNAIVTRLEKILGSLLGENITLATDLTPDVGLVNVDTNQIDQVILNLASNSKDAMPDGGTLTIATQPGTAEAAAGCLPPGTDPAAFVRLSVTDTGFGMDPATLERAFEPFFTTKPKGRGTGLGLSAVYGIVRQTGGHVFADSTLGHGTTIELWLPRSAANDDHPTAGLAPGPELAGGSETILVVEDQAAVRRLARQVLAKCGYRVLDAVDGDDAIRLAGQFPGRIDLIVTDMVMPGISGPVAVERIRQQRTGTRVLYVSGFAAADVARDPRDPFLAKPFTPAGLAQAVRATLDRPV